VEEEDEEWFFYTSTFRISKQTGMQGLKSVACDFWGFNEKNYRFYNE
jgi:hypothetical protein